MPETRWLAPLCHSLATGRSHELEERFEAMRHRWERSGRLVHRPLKLEKAPSISVEASVVSEVQRLRSLEGGAGEALPILQCAEAECVVLS